MNIKFNYFDNIIKIVDDKILTIEIENKGSFYRTVKNFVNISNDEIIEDIYCFNNQNEEINLTNKISIIFDYFNFETYFKKYSTTLSKFIINECDDITNDKLSKDYKKLKDNFQKFINQLELPITINDEFSIELLVKLLKPTINTTNNILENLFLIIELEKIFHLNKLIVLVNLKQYLNKEELKEFYKYIIYNNIKVLLLDSQSYGPTIEYETKLIIDNNLDEIVI